MSNAALYMLAVTLLAGTPVTVTTLEGRTLNGELAELSEQSLTLTTPEGDQQVSRDELMLVEFPHEEQPPDDDEPHIQVRLTDGSRIAARRFEADRTMGTFASPAIGDAEIPFRQIRDVRIGRLDDKVTSGWQDLQERAARDDLLVFRKGDVLDYVAGSVSRINPETVTILVRERELTAPLDRVFGVVFASRGEDSRARTITVRTVHGDELQARGLKREDDHFTLSVSGDVRLRIPADTIRSFDFGGGRIRFLADLPFDESQSKPPNEDLPVVWYVSKNAPAGTAGTAPLVIGQDEYRRGLWLHSGATLRFRLNREYQKLRSVAGFDLTHASRMPRFDPRVKLVILGDERELYAREFGWNDTPEELDVDLSDVRELVIRVESLGSGFGILEHFALGDAQVIR